VGDSFDFIARRLGLDQDDVEPETVALPSPFDYARQAVLAIPTDFPSPNEDGAVHLRRTVEAAAEFVEASDGGAFLLFTSHRDVREAEEKEGRKMWGIAEGHDRIVGALLSLPLESPPGTAFVYSDLGFILLGRAMEAASFMTLDRLLRRELSGPLGMRDTGYLPLLAVSECETGRLISTGHSEERGRETVGEVDDENAAAMGGVAGHAGIFSTAHDLFLFAREILRARRGEGRVLSRRMAEEMTTKVSAPPGCPRTPGWDTPTPGSPGGSQAGRHFPEGSVGHLGWTGCSLWIDLSREITCVLLTNRVYYGQQNQGLTTLRPTIHDAVIEALDQE